MSTYKVKVVFRWVSIIVILSLVFSSVTPAFAAYSKSASRAEEEKLASQQDAGSPYSLEGQAVKGNLNAQNTLKAATTESAVRNLSQDDTVIEAVNLTKAQNVTQSVHLPFEASQRWMIPAALQDLQFDSPGSQTVLQLPKLPSSLPGVNLPNLAASAPAINDPYSPLKAVLSKAGITAANAKAKVETNSEAQVRTSPLQSPVDPPDASDATEKTPSETEKLDAPSQSNQLEAKPQNQSQGSIKLYIPAVYTPYGLRILAGVGGKIQLSDESAEIVFKAGGLPGNIRASVKEISLSSLPHNFAITGPAILVKGYWEQNGETVNELDPAAKPIRLANAAKPTPEESRYWATIRMQLQPGQTANYRLAIGRQDEQSGKWELLPTQWDAQTNTVQAKTDRLGNFALIENMALTAQSEPPAENTVIVDDRDAGFTYDSHDGTKNYFWSTNCSSGGCWAGDALWTYNRSEFEPLPLDQPWNWAKWTPTLADQGWYQVYAFIPSSRATTAGARYKIFHAGQEDQITINQAVISGDWVYLGPFEFSANGGEYVYLDDVVPEKDEYPTGNWSYVGMDAVKFVYAGTEPPPPADTEPPTIALERWLDGNGNVLVRAKVTDNTAVGEVVFIFNGVSMTMIPVGDDIYEAWVPVPKNQISQYQVVAKDIYYNVATFPPGTPFQLRGYLSRNLGQHNFTCNSYGCNPGYQGSDADPVNTSNGNFFYHHQDAVINGVGNTSILIERSFNSLPNEPIGVISYTVDANGNIQETLDKTHPDPFGQGWIFPFAVHLLRIESSYFDGIQIRYPDGYTANFTRSDDGSYEPVETRIYDRLVATSGGYVLTLKDLTEYRFDRDGRLLKVVDPNNNAISLTYSGDQISRITNESGRSIDVAYNADGYISVITGSEGLNLQYRYENGHLRFFIDSEGNQTEYHYDSEGRLVAVITPKGHPGLRMTYNEMGQVIDQTVGSSALYTFAYDDDVTTITDPNGRATIHVYDEKDRLIEARDVLGTSEFYGYNDLDQRVFFKDRMGREWRYVYDERGNRLSEDGPLSWHQEWDYNHLNLVSRAEDSLGHETFMEYDSQGNLVKVILPDRSFAEIFYDGRGLPTDVYDFNQNYTQNQYHPVTGDLFFSWDGEAALTQYSYDLRGRPTAITLPEGGRWTFVYDRNDRMTDIHGPLGYHLGYAYDANDHIIGMTDANGGETVYTYDADENMVESRDPMGFVTTLAYDGMSHILQLEDAEHRVWTWEYDVVYRAIAENGPEGTRTLYRYDAVDNVTDVTQCNGPLGADPCAVPQVTHYVYDALDRATRVVENYDPNVDETSDTNVTTELTYDLAGNVQAITDPLDNVTEFRYDPLNRRSEIKDALGQMLKVTYDGMGNITQITNPRSYAIKMTYDGNNQLKTSTDALNQTWRFVYDGNGNLVEMIDPLNIVTRMEYNELDQLTSQIQNYVASGATTTEQNVKTRFEWDLSGNLRFVFDPRGTYVTEHRYDANFRRILTIDAEAGQTLYAYDKVGNLISVTDANLHTTTLEYDGLDQLIKITNPESHAVRFVYDRLGNLLTLTDARSNSTRFEYDGLNRPILVTDAMSGEWHYSWDAVGNLLDETDANGHTNTYVYDAIYRLLSITDAEDIVTQRTYDENGNILTLTDGNQHTTVFTYDPLDRLASEKNAETETTFYGYDPRGNRTQIIAADEIINEYRYDSLYRLAVVILNSQPGAAEAADVNVDTHYSYDAAGNLTEILDANEHATHFSYDGLNRAIQETDADGNTWRYKWDPVGNLGTRIDANGNQTSYAYYPDNQLKQTTYSLDGAVVVFTYDENNNRTAMTDRLGTTTWAYDPLNRLVDSTDAWGRHVGYGYDAAGNRTRITYPDGREVFYIYYANDWLKTVTDPEGNVTTYSRDGVGLPVFIDNPNDTISELSYDAANRALTVVNRQVVGAQETNSAFTYIYDEVGQRIQVTAQYGWRQPNTVTTTYSYDGVRRLVGDQDSEGVWTRYTFDRVGNRLEMQTNDERTSSTPFDELLLYYGYSDNNQLMTVVGDTRPGSQGLKRPANVNQPLYAFQHEVEAQTEKHISAPAADHLLAMVNNLIADLESNKPPKTEETTQRIAELRVQVQAYQSSGDIDSAGITNSLLVKLDLADQANVEISGEMQTTAFTHDGNGNRINKEFPGPQGPQIQGTDYTFDGENRLVRALDYQMNEQGNRVDRAETCLEYDGLGRKLAKEYEANADGCGDNNQQVEYAYDGLDPIAEFNTWNSQYDNFYRGDLNRIITMHHFPDGTQGQMYWYHHDGLGSVVGLTKHSGQSSHNYRYDSNGKIVEGDFTDPHNHYTFTGKEWDENIEFYDFGARNYDPGTGSWTSQDPFRGTLDDPTSLHRYSYVGANPVNYVDMYGFSRVNPGSIGPTCQSYYEFCTATWLRQGRAPINHPILDGIDAISNSWLYQQNARIETINDFIFGPLKDVSKIDRRFKIGSSNNPSWFTRLVPKTHQRSVVLAARKLYNKIPTLITKPLEKYAQLSEKVKKPLGGAYMVTFITAPFFELRTSINMVDNLMQNDTEITPVDAYFLYPLLGALDAASYGVGRNFLKTPTLFMPKDMSENWSAWVDRNINAVAVTDMVVDTAIRAKNGIVSAASWVADKTTDVKDGIVSGVTGAANATVDAVKGAWSHIWNQ